jgi:arginine repressor
MGQREIKELLKNKRLCNDSSFMTNEEINKALKNLGFIYNRGSTASNLRKLKKFGFLEVKERDYLRKEYRLKEEYLKE